MVEQYIEDEEKVSRIEIKEAWKVTGGVRGSL